MSVAKSSQHSLPLRALAAPLALCRLTATEDVPAWTAEARTFLTISRTPTELSIVADESAVPADVSAQRGYRALRVEGPLPLDLIGIFAGIASPLADAGIPIFPIATYDTDYVLVAESTFAKAVEVLEAAGHRVVAEEVQTAQS
jgi:hypothetical protein